MLVIMVVILVLLLIGGIEEGKVNGGGVLDIDVLYGEGGLKKWRKVVRRCKKCFDDGFDRLDWW